MNELSLNKMSQLEGGSWWDCAAMVAFGLGTVAFTVGAAAAGPIGLAGAGVIVGGTAAMLDSAEDCASTGQ